MLPYYLCADSEEKLWTCLEAAGLADLSPPQLDVMGTLFEATGLILVDEQDHRYPHFRPLKGYYAVVHRELNEAERSVLPVVPRPASIVRICA
ncbi:MAG: hypothetical protein FGM18_01005 [Burkholderiaceae bacterium]|nr:hypothetical protein [Burkholderiaceae bacterium]